MPFISMIDFITEKKKEINKKTKAVKEISPLFRVETESVRRIETNGNLEMKIGIQI